VKEVKPWLIPFLDPKRERIIYKNGDLAVAQVFIDNVQNSDKRDGFWKDYYSAKYAGLCLKALWKRRQKMAKVDEVIEKRLYEVKFQHPKMLGRVEYIIIESMTEADAVHEASETCYKTRGFSIPMATARCIGFKIGEGIWGRHDRDCYDE
jgi:hypothetical protein